MTFAKHIRYLLIGLMSIMILSSCVPDKKPIDMTESVLGHLSDSYEWHITTINDHHITIPLLVIVKSQKTGEWNIFSSEKFHESENGHYCGFYINKEKKSKVYEEGYDDRPLDLSITRNVLQIWINVIIMLFVFLSAAKWYKRHKVEDGAPKGFTGMVETAVLAVQDDIIKPSVGEKQYKKYSSYLQTVFFFILICNLMGLIPIFPGGSNITGNITITFLLSFFTLLLVNLFGNREYWKEILWPDVPILMKVPVPLMPVIELFGIITKPFALMIRLFANMFGGHAVILSLTCIIFITWQISSVLGSSMTVVSFVLIIFMNLLELLVAFIQAYVFTMLSAVFIGLAHPESHKK